MNILNECIETEVSGEYDVIVAGGGPAGIGAAIASARSGMKTLLVERYGFLGGMWTAGLINPIFDNGGKGGIMQEIIDELSLKNAWGGFIGQCFQYEQMKVVLDKMVCDAGVVPLYHTWIAKCICEDNVVKGIIIENKDGRKVVYAKMIIDCSGDADVAVSAGADYVIGRASDSKVQPMTLMFVLGNINFKQEDAKQLYRMMKEATEKYKTDYEIPYTFPYIIQLPAQSQAVVQLTHIRNVLGTNTFDLTKAEIEGRKQVMDTVEFFKKYIAEFKDIELLYTAPQIGVRETRRIVGEYVLTKEDLIVGRNFEDAITSAAFGIDIHNPDNTDQEVIEIKPYQIPYRCLIPKKLEGILVAGRCISGTNEAFASYRVTGNCVAMGEAAGKAVSVAIKTGKGLRDVSIKEL